MIIVDKALEKRQHENNPIRVAMIGAGFMGRGVALQILNAVQGMELVAISNRHLDGARRAYSEAGVEEVRAVETVTQLEDAITQHHYAITEDAMLLCQAEGIDAVIEVTGIVEFGAQVALKAIENKKHVITMNAELDGTVGPILKVYADKAGVIFTGADGDQPGVIMNLFRFVKSIGVKPVLCGNIKGSSRPVPKSDHSGRICSQMGAESSYGHLICRWYQDFVRTSHRGERHRHEGCEARHVRPDRSHRHTDSTSGQ